MNEVKVSHEGRRWALRGTKYKGGGTPSKVWWVGTGFVGDEEICGLYTHAKAQEILDWLCSNEGVPCRLDDFAYDIVRVL